MKQSLALVFAALVGCVDDEKPEPPPVVAGTGGQWEVRAALATPRQEHGVVALAGEVVTVGGFDADNTVIRVDAYDPADDAWRVLPSLPLPLHHPNVGVVQSADGERLVIGGFLLGGDFRADARTFVLDGDAWRQTSSMPSAEARGASASCGLLGALYVFGGFQNGSVGTASRYLVDDDVWQELPALPLNLDHVLCVGFDAAVWIVSGRANGLRNHSAVLWRYDPTSETYEERAAMPSSRAGAAAAVLDGHLYVVGGEGNPDDDDGVFAEAERYDFAADRWESIVDMRTPRHGMGAAAVDGAVYVPGGAPVQGFGAITTNERFVPE